MESRGTAPGAQLCTVPSPVGVLGVTVCYDLRFPELYQTLRFEQGAEVSVAAMIYQTLRFERVTKVSEAVKLCRYAVSRGPRRV